MAEELFRMEGISKSFPGVKALDKVHLDVNKGEVLGLVGENGAGKSTLMKILSAYTTPTRARSLSRAKRSTSTLSPSA